MSIEKNKKQNENEEVEKDIFRGSISVSNQWDPMLRKIDTEDGGAGEHPSENKSKLMYL